MSVRIRKATLQDAETAWKVRNSAIMQQCAGHYPVDDLQVWTSGTATERFAEAVARSWYVAEVDSMVVGTCDLDQASGHVDSIFVHPDMMGQGIGCAMMEYLEQLAIKAGLTHLALDSTLNAAPFYRKCGFVGHQESVYESPRGISLPCIPMTKQLKTQ